MGAAVLGYSYHTQTGKQAEVALLATTARFCTGR